MIVLADNDILLKLCALDLLHETLTWLGVETGQVRVLSSAEPYVRKNRTRLAAQYGPEAIDRTMDLLAKAKETRTGSLREAELLRDVNGIGSGEAILMGATSEYPEYVLLTDDTRSLHALAQSNECKQIAARLEGRVYCLPVILLGLIQTRGWSALQSKILPKRHIDRRVEWIFANAEQLEERVLLVRLRKSVDSLRAKTGKLLQH